MPWSSEWNPEDVTPWHPDRESPERMPDALKPAFDSYRHVIWEHGEPRNLGEARLANVREVLNRTLSLLAVEDEIEIGEVFWVGSMMAVAALRLRPRDWNSSEIDEELDEFAEELESMALNAAVYRVHEWNSGKEIP